MNLVPRATPASRQGLPVVVAAILLLLGLPAAAQTPSLDSLWQRLEAQEARIQALTEELAETKSELSASKAQAEVTEEQLGVTADYVEKLAGLNQQSAERRTQVGGYGELHYNNLSASDSDRDLEQIDFHRFVGFLGHQFTDRIRFFSEVEIEHALVEDTDDGSGKGELELEQAFIEFDLNDNLAARGGLFLLPIGILNETHEPTTFYGVERNDVENIIIPSTWWEAGAAAGGRYGNGLAWDLALHSGLQIPTSGSSAFRIRSGRQKVAEAIASHPAITGRVRYTGISGLELAASLQYQDDITQATGDGAEDATLVSLHGIWQWQQFQLRALWSEWQIDGDLVALADADKQRGWYVEPSFRLGRGNHDWGFYGRFEDLRGARDRDRFEQWELGFNYWPVEGVVLKFNYRDRDHDLASESGRDFKGVDLGLGYQF